MKAILANFLKKIKSATPFLLGLYTLPLLLLAWVVIAHKTTGVPLYKYTWDLANFKGVRPSFGILSNMGVLLWCGTAVVSIFSWSVIRGRVSSARQAYFLLFSGLLTLVLMVDDLFLIHEEFGARGIPETVVYGGYLLFAVGLFVVHRKFVLKSEYLILLAAGGFLGLSLMVDIYQEPLEAYMGDWAIFAEDGFKFLGIVGWFGYYLRTCYYEIKRTDRVVSGDVRN